jgi:hypothetical protein
MSFSRPDGLCETWMWSRLRIGLYAQFRLPQCPPFSLLHPNPLVLAFDRSRNLQTRRQRCIVDSERR